MSQIGIVVFGVLAIWLSQSEDRRYREWACVAGLVGQPFWFWASYHAEQWGIFAISFLYTAAWAKGFYTYWVRK